MAYLTRPQVWEFFAVVFLSLRIAVVTVYAGEINHVGPAFTIQPPPRVQFYNSTGAVVSCSASGVPLPSVTWMRQDEIVHDIPDLLHVGTDGSLNFSPFRPENFRQDIHSAIYRCTASNAVGTIGSRDVNVRAVFR